MVLRNCWCCAMPATPVAAAAAPHRCSAGCCTCTWLSLPPQAPAPLTRLLPPWPTAGCRYSREVFTREGRLRHIHRLNYWPLEKVLEEKYKFPRAEVRVLLPALCSLVAPCLGRGQRAHRCARGEAHAPACCGGLGGPVSSALLRCRCRFQGASVVPLLLPLTCPPACLPAARPPLLHSAAVRIHSINAC